VANQQLASVALYPNRRKAREPKVGDFNLRFKLVQNVVKPTAQYYGKSWPKTGQLLQSPGGSFRTMFLQMWKDNNWMRRPERSCRRGYRGGSNPR
jgi:hypothetical protein